MIEPSYLADIAIKIETDITKVIINNSITINSFTLEHVTGSMYELKFLVAAVQTTLITNIKLAKANDTVISSNDVSIPISTNDVQIRQTITVSEVIV